MANVKINKIEQPVKKNNIGKKIVDNIIEDEEKVLNFLARLWNKVRLVVVKNIWGFVFGAGLVVIVFP